MRDYSVDNIVKEIKAVWSKESIPLHEPTLIGNEWNYVKDCLDTNWISSVGSYVTRFEQAISEFTGIPFAVAVVNGTAALHISLLLGDIRKNDEVLVPALTFVATANAISYVGAVPHFVDSEWDTLGVDPDKLMNYLENIAEMRDGVCINKATGRFIRAIVPMHTFGHPNRMAELSEVAKRFHLQIIEDCAESLGTSYAGKHTGSWSKVAALSFNGNKIITTGGGGAIITNDEELARKAKHITTTAKSGVGWNYFHDQVGYNYRMPNINAAVGCAQMEQLPLFVEQKRKLAQEYLQIFKHIEGVQIIQEPIGAVSNYWLNALRLESCTIQERDRFIQKANEAGVNVRPTWVLMHKLPMYQDCPRMELPTAEEIERTIVNIPSSVKLLS